MSRKVLKKKYYKEAGEEEEAIEENKTVKPDLPGHFPVLNPKEVRANDRILIARDGFGRNIESPGTSGSRRMTSSARGSESSAGTAALTSHAYYHGNILQETRPGAVVVAGFDNEEGVEDDDRTIDEEQATRATGEESTGTVNVVARVVDTEEENRRLCEHDRLRHEHDQLLRERNRLRDVVDSAVVVTPVVATHTAEGEDHTFCTRGRQWCVGVILLVLVAVAIALALVLPPEPTPEPTTPEPTTPEPTTPEPTSQEPTTQEPTTQEPTTQEPATPMPQDLIDLLSSASSDGGVNLATPTTPQNKAYVWLAGNSGLEEFTDQVKLERYALATFYFSTKGDTWTQSDYWLSDEDVCFTPWFGVECTGDGAVKWLDNWGNDLLGTLPPEIGMLSTSLEALFLSESSLEGAIPSEIGELTNLISLDLNSCKLTGTIPKEINSLTYLAEVYLYDNMLTGSYTCPNFINTCFISCNYEDDNCRSL